MYKMKPKYRNNTQSIQTYTTLIHFVKMHKVQSASDTEN